MRRVKLILTLRFDLNQEMYIFYSLYICIVKGNAELGFSEI